MAEIKSTLELVLEKTKHLSLSAEEKAEMQLRDFLKKLTGYVERILDGTLVPEKLLEEIEAQPQELRDRARKGVARHMSDALDLSPRSDPLMAALELLAEPDWSTLLAEVKSCRSSYRESRDVAWQQAQNRALASLAAAGIRGSAVVAKLEGTPSWEAEDSQLRQPCEELLASLRGALKD